MTRNKQMFVIFFILSMITIGCSSSNHGVGEYPQGLSYSKGEGAAHDKSCQLSSTGNRLSGGMLMGKSFGIKYLSGTAAGQDFQKAFGGF